MSQLTQADLKGMSPQAISQARSQGRLEAVLGRPASVGQALDGLSASGTASDGQDADSVRVSQEHASDGQLTHVDLMCMSSDQILQAKAEGRCDALLGRQAPRPQADAASA